LHSDSYWLIAQTGQNLPVKSVKHSKDYRIKACSMHTNRHLKTCQKPANSRHATANKTTFEKYKKTDKKLE